MTLVTTSRKAIPEVRALSRGFAIATGCEFVTRGKMGLRDLFTRDPHIIIFTQETGGIRVQFFTEEDPVADYKIRLIRVEDRTESKINGIGTPQPGRYEILSPFVAISTVSMRVSPETIILDGPQKKRFFCELVPYGA